MTHDKTPATKLHKEALSTERALKLALEALNWFVEKEMTVGQRYINEGQKTLDALSAIREALADHALDKLAENERELGIQMQPEQEDIIWDTYKDTEYFGLTKEHTWISVSKAQYDKLRPKFRMACIKVGEK